MMPSHYSILLVEDDHHVAQMMLSIFSIMKIAAAHAENTDQALKLTECQEYDLHIIDVHLGVEDGLVLAKKIKQFRPKSSFITMSGDAPEAIEGRIKKLPAIHHFAKPFEVNEFTRVIEKVLHQLSSQSILRT